MNSELFVCLREKYGSTYEEYVKSKLIPVVGNICEPNLGMDINSANKIMEEVDVIVQSAASTTFFDRLLTYIQIFLIKLPFLKNSYI